MTLWGEGIVNIPRPKVTRLQTDPDSPLVQLLDEIAGLRKSIENQKPAQPTGPELGALVAGLSDIAASIRQTAAPASGGAEVNLEPVLQEIRALSQVTPPGPAAERPRDPVKWKFTIERDENGLLTEVIAEPLLASEENNGLESY